MFCPKCGNEIQALNRFCGKCGCPVPSGGPTAPPAPQPFVPQQPAVQNLAPGAVIDSKYRIEALIGAGGMGDVYRATRLLIGDSVAVKILRPHLAVDPQSAERFRREALAASQLRHRNIVGIFDVGIVPSIRSPYILMELADGMSLRLILSRGGALSVDFAVTVIAQVCAGLSEAHSMRIVHRDIKPENIIAKQTPTGWHVKILDFGIAKVSGYENTGLTLDGTSIGTPNYMSPEQCQGEQTDGRSDIYSLAVVAYEMLTGRVPFSSGGVSAVVLHHVQTPPPPPSSLNPAISPGLESVILRALSKKREDRFSSALEFSRAFIAAATESVRGAAPVSVPEIHAPTVQGERSSENEVDAESVDAPVAESDFQVDEVGSFPEVSPVEEDAASIQPEDEVPAEIPEEPDGDTLPAAAEQESTEKNFEDASGADGPAVEVISEEFHAPIEVYSDVRSDEGEIPDGGIAETLEFSSTEIGASDSGGESFDGLAADSDETQASFVEAVSPIIASDVDDRCPAVGEVEAQTDSPLADGDEAETRAVEVGSESIEDPEYLEDVSEASPDEPPSADAHWTDAVQERSTAKKEDRTRLFVGIAAGALLQMLLVGSAVYLASGWFAGDGTSGSSKPSGSGLVAPEGMVFVPEGEFTMGDDSEQYSRPSRKVKVKGFFIDVYEVTNEQYQRYIEATGARPPKGWSRKTFPKGKGRYPVTGVTWDDAVAFAKWRGMRLPTEEEWEYAARGSDGRKFPWGDEWVDGNANTLSAGLVEVGKFPGRSPFGLFDMAGNAWEWTSSDAGAYPGGEAFATKSSREEKVIRGGRFGATPDKVTVFFRRPYPVKGSPLGYRDLGFRCVKDTQ